MESNFIIKWETVICVPNYDALGKPCSIIVENGRLIEVDMKPSDLINENLLYYGSSLQGATEGASRILGNTYSNPIAISEKQNIYWLPSKSPASDECVWFALHHIVRLRAFGKAQTEVQLTGGHKIVIDSSFYTLTKREMRAYTLKGKIERRSEKPAEMVREEKNCYYISKPNGKVNYELKKQDKDS